MDYKTFIQSKPFKKILLLLGGALVLLIVFQAGIFVGFRKAGFSYRGGENYYKTFGGEKNFMDMVGGKKLSNAHGTIGKIIKIELPTIIVQDRDGIEKIITVADNSIIMRQRDALQPKDLKIGDMVTIIGSPNDKGEIEARLIRLLPPPPPDFINNSNEKI